MQSLSWGVVVGAFIAARCFGSVWFFRAIWALCAASGAKGVPWKERARAKHAVAAAVARASFVSVRFLASIRYMLAVWPSRIHAGLESIMLMMQETVFKSQSHLVADPRSSNMASSILWTPCLRALLRARAQSEVT